MQQTLIDQINKQQIAAYIIPTQDEFQNEFVPECNQRLKAITGFSGSNGVAVIGKGKSAFLAPKS